MYEVHCAALVMKEKPRGKDKTELAWYASCINLGENTVPNNYQVCITLPNNSTDQARLERMVRSWKGKAYYTRHTNKHLKIIQWPHNLHLKTNNHCMNFYNAMRLWDMTNYNSKVIVIRIHTFSLLGTFRVNCFLFISSVFIFFL